MWHSVAEKAFSTGAGISLTYLTTKTRKLCARNEQYTSTLIRKNLRINLTNSFVATLFSYTNLNQLLLRS